MDPVALDSLQAARDTFVVVQAESTSWLEWASFVVSVLIAGFTGGYLYYTTKIFSKTKKQAEAAADAAEASLESNTIQKRANFYPTFDIGLDGDGRRFQELVVTLTPLDGSIIQQAYLYGLLGYEPGTLDVAEFSNNSLLFGRGVGNVVSKTTLEIDAENPITSATLLLRFVDPLGNVYYRFQSFGIEVRDDRLVSQHTGTITNQMVPTKEYHPVSREEGIYFVPLSSITREGDIESFDVAQEDAPRPVKVFSRKTCTYAVGTLGKLPL
jgi:hypothetical protein